MNNIEFIEKVWGEDFLANYMNNVIENWHGDMFDYAMSTLRKPVNKTTICGMFNLKESTQGIEYWCCIMEVNIEEELNKISKINNNTYEK